MVQYLNDLHRQCYEEFVNFSIRNIDPFVNKWESNEAVDKEIIASLAQNRYLGGTIPSEYGGLGWDMITYGLLNAAIGYSSPSLTGLFNVHTMVSQTLLKWGTEGQKQKWLSKMAKGEILGAFALTEPSAGSDTAEIKTQYVYQDDHLVLNGTKKWITFSGLADIFLVFGKIEDKHTVAIVEASTPGIEIVPIKNMLGFKTAHLSEIHFKDVKVKMDQIVGKIGMAQRFIAPYALDFGRISVAWASLGILHACYELCGAYTLARKTFNNRIIDHGSIRTLMADIGVEFDAAALLCYNACLLKNNGDADFSNKILSAKYYTSRAAARHASNAVQIFGAVGCNESNLVSRHYRDAKVMEVVEGTSQIMQMLLGKYYAHKGNRSTRVLKPGK